MIDRCSRPLAWLRLLTLCSLALACCRASIAEDFRTDENQDEKLLWFQVQPGEFPPEGSAHYFAGELIGIDHVNRRGTLRVDRTDAQRRSHWDLPVDFQMLPYGAIRYRGAPAALRDIPLGTHLHGRFYIKAADDPGMKTIFHNRASIEADFNRAFLLEDDFSYYSRQQRAWRVESIDLEGSKLTVRACHAPGQTSPHSDAQESLEPEIEDAQPVVFDVLPTTRIWKGNALGSHRDLAAGQIIQVNLTWATLFGPGRCTEIWLDQESRDFAVAEQLAKHHQHQRERGLAGWVDEVDNRQSIVTVTLFGGIDHQLLEGFKEGTTLTVVVASPSLRSHDQVNDRQTGPILAVKSVPVQPGSSGVQVRFQPSLLLEGFRPGYIVRLFASDWPVQSLPQEEQLFPERD